MDKNTFSITRLTEEMGWNNLNPLRPSKSFSESFYQSDKGNDKYIEPNFSFKGGNRDSSPKIVLISAAGAVGKSELTNYLSFKYKLPIFNLTINKPVGDYSMTGILSRTYDLTEVKTAMANGNQAVIIDALDEGYLKVTNDAFFSFIDDIISLLPDSKLSFTPFVMLGRTNIMDLVKKYLSEKDIDYFLIQIDPFTEKQAKEFLYKYNIGDDKQKYTRAYQEIVDYIIDSIRSFFKSQSDYDKASYENFIGYAPVLMAIAELLEENRNYKKLKEKLERSGETNVRLLMSLMDDILDREQKKVYDNMLVQMLTSYDDETAKIAKEKCYSRKEQCFRLLAKVLGMENEEMCEVEDKTFIAEYEKNLTSFKNEHPFLNDGIISNAVFESYVVATVASMEEEYAMYAEEYIQSKLKNSFAFYPIMTKMIVTANINPSQKYFPALYSSLSSQSQEMLHTEVDITTAPENNKSLIISFDNENLNFHEELRLHLDDSRIFNIGEIFGNADINGDFNVRLSSRSTNLRAPLSIECLDLICGSDEISVVSHSDEDLIVIISCNKVQFDTKAGVPVIKHAPRCNISIFSKERPSHPFSKYYKSEPYKPTDPNYEKYQKLRGIIQQFRSHGKGRGNWGKKKDKIYRRYAYGVGKQTLDALLKNGILYEKKHLYKMDTDKLRDVLHLTYEEMLNGKINDSVNIFLASYPDNKS